MASLLVLLSLLSLLALVVPLPRSTVFPILTHAVAFSIPILFRQCSRRRQRRAASRATTGSGEYGTETTGLYGLDHAVLNARLKFPPDKMWMNMGYWRPGQFQQRKEKVFHPRRDRVARSMRSPLKTNTPICRACEPDAGKL
ncbi:hypothetical protein CIHG_01286 [Coccidioides immitis H538.4]|uniref:Uncharacterized protein n=1 Tax=Coccidioides immitis H538.4 TaxID=396776 RepID=A0A0J8RHM6_COCIT|nr:hypothetical protein CIHG_01286 [Coccidioides immitis H538.4]